jgi:hypothetical protein
MPSFSRTPRSPAGGSEILHLRRPETNDSQGAFRKWTFRVPLIAGANFPTSETRILNQSHAGGRDGLETRLETGVDPSRR